MILVYKDTIILATHMDSQLEDIRQLYPSGSYFLTAPENTAWDSPWGLSEIQPVGFSAMTSLVWSGSVWGMVLTSFQAQAIASLKADCKASIDSAGWDTDTQLSFTDGSFSDDTGLLRVQMNHDKAAAFEEYYLRKGEVEVAVDEAGVNLALSLTTWPTYPVATIEGAGLPLPPVKFNRSSFTVAEARRKESRDQILGNRGQEPAGQIQQRVEELERIVTSGETTPTV